MKKTRTINSSVFLLLFCLSHTLILIFCAVSTTVILYAYNDGVIGLTCCILTSFLNNTAVKIINSL